MNNIKKYNEFLLEKEFQSILNELLLLVESNRYNIDDKEEFKSGDIIDFNIEKENKFKDFFDKLTPLKKIKDFLLKLKDDETIKSYFLKLVNEFKNIPYRIKKGLLVKVLLVFTSFISIHSLITPDVEKIDPILSEVKMEVINKVDNKETVTKTKSSFDIAQKFVSLKEGGYTDFRNDKGNWTSNNIGSGLLIGTNHGISALTLISADILPTEKEYKLFKMCYGKNYNKLCGSKKLTFKEQWENDKKYIKSQKDLETKWKRIMMSLNYKTALSIFKSDYWSSQNLSMLTNQSVANIIYDGCVNQGIGAMSKVLKSSIRKMGINISDGERIFSPKWIEKVNELDQQQLFKKIKKERENIYRDNDRFSDFGKGWLDRLAEIEFKNHKNSDIA
jgi:lysozyme family protein